MNTQQTAKRLTALVLIIILTVAGLPVFPAQALTYPQTILADSPVHYYRLNETSGSSAADSAYGSPATYQISPTFSRTGAIYDGDTAIGATLGQINTGVIYSGYGAVNHTIGCEVWFKIYSASAAVNAVRYLCWIVAGSENMWARVAINSLGVAQLNLVHTSNSTLATAVTFDTWHHAYMQYDNTTHYLSLYYDGNLVLSASDTAFTTANAAVRWGTGAGNLQIDLDEAALYEHALTAAQIKFHYDNGFSAVATPSPTPTNTPLVSPTPTATYTPSVTPTPTNTPTPTITPSPTPGYDYAITLPGGGQGRVAMDVSAGEILNGVLLFMVVALLIGVMYAVLKKQGSS